MKKTWTTRILIALMTLAIVGGVFGVAPRGAQAAAGIAISAPEGTALSSTRQSLPLSLTLTGLTPGADATYDWTIDTPNALTIQKNGASATVSAGTVFSGTVTVTATYKDSTQTLTDTETITVTPSVTLGKTSTSIEVGKSEDLTYSTYPANIMGVTWESNGGSNVTVSQTGKVSADAYTSTAATITVKLNADLSKTAACTVNVTKIKAVITPPANFSIEKGKTVTLSATSNNTTGDITWTPSSGGSIATSPTKSGVSVTYTAPNSTGTQTIELTQAASGDYDAADKKIVTVTVTSTVPTVTISPASASISYPNGSQAFTATSTSPSTGTTFTWYVDNVATGTTGPNYTYTPSSTGSHKVKVTATCTGYETTSKEATVTVSARMDLGVSSISTKVGATDTSFNVTTSGTTTISATSANTGIATVTPSSIAGNVTNTFTVKPIAAGDTTITISDGTTSKSIPVHVAGAYPVITTSFNANTIGGNSLSKVYAWGQLTIRVKDYNPAIPYVTVTRSNIRTYMLGGSYYTHPSTYTYTAYLTQDGNDGVASPSIVAQYNGSTYYTVAYTGASNVNSTTIYVTGFTTLPQTGPDYTWAYVLGGLCLITVATAVTLNVRKKKRESI